ncbi:AraC family transcriptional regulator [Oceanirhabdus sp. W0125-5]|uniref:AraC family transcriptional regulator n=1 Tax=Oceanirhabdus sp. W0125-5 TaxID=2999116 RepID=UPI0022F337C7|nr:helix-turn-helix domain-containing protein [Oceanirhabdus sp. W0125-5]WBW97287.1 helix-turn-helix domain-containing protein [Oceanirhabdus sp. W0125-5]
MDYFSVIQNAVDFIEEKLLDSFSIEDVACKIGFSIPHFYRIFSAIVGETPKNYIRKRRISVGALMLRESNLNICDIAFETGFESHEVFIRAFKKIYGVSPKNSKILDTLPLYEKFDVMRKKRLYERDVLLLDTKIIIKNSFKIIGKTINLNQAEQVENNLIDKFFNEFNKEKINYPVLNKQDKIYSLYEYDADCIHKEDENIDYFYTLGVEYDQTACVPEGFVIKEIPKSKYALFIYNTKEKTLNGESISSLKYEGKPITNVYDYIDGVWILNSGYTLSDNPDFEIRDSNSDGIIEYYISVEDK